jgi:hypothetical protein
MRGGRLPILSRWLRRGRHQRRVAKLHNVLETHQRAIDAIEVANSEAEIQAALAQRDRSSRRRRVLLLAAGVAVIVTGTGTGALLATRDDDAAVSSPGKKSAAPESPKTVIAPKCPVFTPPPVPDLPVGGHGPISKFEDGGQLAHSFFYMYHPKGFMAGPLYSQHYELFRKADKRVRIWIGWDWPTGNTEPEPYVEKMRRQLAQKNGYRDLGTEKTVFGCQWAVRWDYRQDADGTVVRSERYFFAAISRVKMHNGVYNVLFEAPAASFPRWKGAFGLVARSFRVNQGIENAEVHTG